MQRCGGGNKILYGLTLATGIAECLGFAGLVFGFASLVFVLKQDGYFSQMCVNATAANNTSYTDCSGQDEHFSLVFTIASFLIAFLSLPNGYLFDRFGTMVTRLLGISLYAIGTLIMAFSSAAYSLLLFVAFPCLAVGGIILLLTNMQIGNLFSAHRSTIITIYNGAFDSSSSVFLIVKVLYEQNISIQTSFLVLSFCSIIHLLRTFLLMPRTHIPYSPPSDYSYGLRFGKSDARDKEETEKMRQVATATGLAELDENADAQGQLENISEEKVPSFRSCVQSWFFLWHLLWLSLMQLRHYLFIGTLNPTLNRLANNDPALVSQFTNAFAITQLCGILCAPWNGVLLDRHKGKPRAPGETEREADLRSAVVSLFVTALQCLLFSVCATVPVLPLQYLTFVLQVLNRSFLYGGHAAFISIAFPACHFGKLYGTVMSLSALISLLQYPCFTLVKNSLNGDPFYVDIALTFLVLLVFIHPLNVFLHCRRMSRERQKRPPVNLGLLTEAKT
ncbi:solute carrier family 43 member 3a [Gadus morhua]|uniref:Solute carrier family 43 member 3a n=1 Tax=Gadus morhua TaxID=8049 RepID=A0A8C5FA54_GADMO|nr:solute carrier family 43 member 3 [Gadus morhua]